MTPRDATKAGKRGRDGGGKTAAGQYRFLQIIDKRKVEPVWNGKTSKVITILLPFQVSEQVDEPRAENDPRMQMNMFELYGRGRKLIEKNRVEMLAGSP